jgi:RHO1 GDP-GTP exchange protein 1/2
MESGKKFEINSIINNFFPISNPINCACPYLNQLIIGTDNGLYVGQGDQVGYSGQINFVKFSKVVDLERIVQVDVIPKIDLILVLSGKLKR